MQIDTPGLTLLPRYDLSPQYIQTFLRFQSYLYRNISWYHCENLGENLSLNWELLGQRGYKKGHVADNFRPRIKIIKFLLA